MNSEKPSPSIQASRPAPSSAIPLEVALEQERFRFGVEEENSRRNLLETQMLLRGALTLLAVGLFRFGLDVVGVTTPPHWSAFILLMIGLLGMTAAAAIALGVTLVPLRVRRRFAHRLGSSHLAPRAGEIRALKAEAESEAKASSRGAALHLLSAFLATHRAANEVAARNQKRATMLSFAKKLLAMSLLVALLGIALMVYAPLERPSTRQSARVIQP